MIRVCVTAWQLAALDVLSKGPKHKQEYVIENILSSLLNEKKCFLRQITVINFSLHMGKSMCPNKDRVVDELRHLKIFRAMHPPYSPDLTPRDFGTFGDFEGKQKGRHLQSPEEILTAFQEFWENITFEELQMTFLIMVRSGVLDH
jgi:hypothetical protein